MSEAFDSDKSTFLNVSTPSIANGGEVAKHFGVCGAVPGRNSVEIWGISNV